MHRLPNEYYRSLELLCRKQAALSSTPDTRKELERMALDYKQLADWLKHQWPDEADRNEMGRQLKAALILPNDFSASAFKHADSPTFARVEDGDNQARAGGARRANFVVVLGLFAQTLCRIGSIHSFSPRLRMRPRRQGWVGLLRANRSGALSCVNLSVELWGRPQHETCLPSPRRRSRV